MLVEGKRLSCQLKIVQEARLQTDIWTGLTGLDHDIQDASCKSRRNPVNPVTAFCSQSRVLFGGGLFGKPRLRCLPRSITIEFAGCRVG